MRQALAGRRTQPVAESYLRVVVDEPESAHIQAAPDAEFEPLAEERFRRWLGSLALSPEEEAEQPEAVAEVNFLERLQAAKAGDPEARAWIDINVDTAVFESVFKKDYVSPPTFMDRDEEGRLVQFGQTNDDIQRNALARPNRHPVLQDVTLAEARNRHRIETALEQEMLKDHYYVVFSLVPEGVPEKELGHEGDGYFLGSLSLNIQATTETSDGRVKTETGFMAGVEEDDDDTFEQRIAKRYDFEAVGRLYEQMGQKAPDTAPELVEHGIYVPKEHMQNGVVDVMYWLELAKSEVRGEEPEHSREDYLGLRLRSKRREAGLDSVRRDVKKELLGAADSPASAMEGIDLVWELVRQRAVEASFDNMDIDPRVFGRSAAPSIVMARHLIDKGDTAAAEEYIQKAFEDAVVTGCGGGGGGSAKAEQDGETMSSILEKIAGSDEYGSLAFLCPDGHLNIRDYGKKLPACQHEDCKAKVAC